MLNRFARTISKIYAYKVYSLEINRVEPRNV